MYNKFAGLIFDMDGTLVDSGQLHEQAWGATLLEYGIPLDRPYMRTLAGVPTKQTLEILLEKFSIAPRVSVDEMNEFKESFVAREMHKFVKPTSLMSIVKQYHGKKPMTVGTGANTQEAEQILRLCGIYDFFDAIVGADQVINPKPAPDTFLRCASLINVSPELCVVFEDSQLGLQAAAAGGMVGVDVLITHQVENDYFL